MLLSQLCTEALGAPRIKSDSLGSYKVQVFAPYDACFEVSFRVSGARIGELETHSSAELSTFFVLCLALSSRFYYYIAAFI